MEPKILYREAIGGGDDVEGNVPNGIVVTLSYWHSVSWKAPSHYLLQSRVMLKHEIVVDEVQYIRASYNDANEIRKAISLFDQLLDLNPDADPKSKNHLFITEA